ncbi:MAG: hypothetical protein PUP91_34380 [Rhizonema sp. PD37]|nr:hypothetical protein [Rhizonema sp. PD37]
MNISDLNYVEDITKQDQLGTVVGGTFGLLGIVPRLLGDIFGYNQQPTTTVINNIYVENTNTSSSSSGSAAGASTGSSHH